MTEFVTREEIARVATIVQHEPAVAPAIVRAEIDRNFELPTGLYAATVGGYLAFLGVLTGSFMNASLVIPTAIFVLFICAAFGVPMLWARMRPETGQRPMTYQAFRNRGIETATGHMTAGAASVQVLILPALILVWGVSIAVIAALA